ncbi:MAG: hypothetical protein RL105_1701 [Verrucomicrobiota bacterium]|jgi:anti-sigma factor RsiW
MSRLEEILLKWQDGSLSADEQRELNALLAQPEARRQLVRELRFDNLVREALRDQQAASVASVSAERFASAPLREPVAEPSSPWDEMFSWLLGRPVLRLALPLLVVGLGTWFALSLDPAASLTLSGQSRSTLVERDGRKIPAPADGFVLRDGDGIVVATGGVAIIGDASQGFSSTLLGPAAVTFRSVEAGPRLSLHRGELRLSSSAVSGPRVEAGDTVALIDQGAMTLRAQPEGVRLEVESGRARWQRLDDGRELTVAEGYFAQADRRPGSEFAVTPLIPRPWNSQDVGPTEAPTFVRFEADSVRLSSAGRGSLGEAGPRRFAGGKAHGARRQEGGFHFVYRSMRGDGEIVARVVPGGGAVNGDAGLVVRRDLTEDAPMAFVGNNSGPSVSMRRGPHGGRQRANAATGDDKSVGPYWVRLVRRGDTVTAFRSKDGRDWAVTGKETIPLAETAYVGLALASDASGADVAFDNISVTSVR